MKCEYGELNFIVDLKWLFVEERVDFIIMKLIFNALHKKTPKNLQTKVSERNQTSRKSLLTPMRKNENIIKSVETNKILNYLPIKIREEIFQSGVSSVNYLF